MKTLVLIISLLSISSFAQNVEINLFPEKLHKKIDYELNKYFKIHKMTGFTLVVANNGRIVLSKSYGFADEVKKEALTPNHRMYMLNCTRIITAAAIMKLLQENKLTLEDKIFGSDSIFALDVPIAPKNVDLLTVRHLLELTVDKSWHEDNSLEKMSPNDHIFNLKVLARKAKFRKKPGNVSINSDIPYYILGRVIEKISGKKYLEYIKEMTAEYTKNEISIMGDGNNKDLVVPGFFRPVRLWFDLEQYDSFKGLVCSPADMMNILLGMDGNPAQKDFLIDASVKIMTSPVRSGP
ncbi:MAG: beta-lactamase family protein, partial [Lentisphaeraceae bacterium]|nr:beta-lactamase family protein [Lentisphaeraceae bacterium]